MSKYTNYIETGIEWLNEIPSHWDKIRLRYLCDITTGSRDTVDREDDGQYPFFVRSKTIERISTYSYDGEAILTAGDGDICKIWHHVNEKFDFHQRVYMLYNFKKITGRFLYYYISENFYYDVFKLSAKNTVDSLRLPMFLNFPVAVPPLVEQTKIAQYLDHQTAIIDQLILQKEKLIELLKEKKQAVINEAVTKGLNPNAKMKDSGIEWLGKVPEHWEVVKFNRYVFLKHGFQFRDYDFTEDGVKVVKITQLKADGTLDVSNASFIDKNRIGEFSEILIEEGDILMALTGGTIGKIIRVAQVDEVLLQNYRVGKFIPTSNKLLKDFLFWVLSSVQIQNQIFFAQRETGQPNIGKEDFGKMIFTLPPVSEQREIVQFIENSIKKTSELIGLIELEIEKLKEYRQSIISEAVTGKIDVRDWQPNKKQTA